MPHPPSTFRRMAAVALLGLALLLLGTATAQPTDAGPTRDLPTAAAFLEADPHLSTFTAIVTRAGRMELLRHRDLVTVFAPTDAAFAALPAATVRTLREDADLARAFVDLHLIDRDLIHEGSGQLVANGAVNPVDRVVALPRALRE